MGAEGRKQTGSQRKKSKPLALSVSVPTDDLGYPVLVGPGLLAKVGHELKRGHPACQRVALVSDENVMPLHGDAARASLEAAGFEVVALVVPAGEATKSPDRLLELVNAIVDARLTRRDCVVALGGGVVGDLAGLAAALFMRGITFLQCPTSLLAQVDASVGGKVAVDLPAGKNLLGAFHFPTAVIIDTEVLQTLPDRELACGLAEMIKHGALFSPAHFDQIVESVDDIYARNGEVLARLVANSVALKAACVSRDPREQADAGKGRIVLNLGHTVGHAIEAVSDYALQHGEAVALGLRAMARVSAARELASPDLEDRFVAALERLRLPTDLDAWLTDERAPAIQAAMENDKKRGSGTVTYIALTELGQPAVINLSAAEIVALLRGREPG